MNTDRSDDLEVRLAVSLRRTGERYFLVWPLWIASAWVAEHYLLWWLQLFATANLIFVFLAICLPNIGRIGSLKRIDNGVNASFHRQLVLADVGALLPIAAIASVWLNYHVSWIFTTFCFGIAFVNSLASKATSEKP